MRCHTFGVASSLGLSVILDDIQALGLMNGLEIVVDKVSKSPLLESANAISQYCRDHGLLLGHRLIGAVSGNIIRILPPRSRVTTTPTKLYQPFGMALSMPIKRCSPNHAMVQLGCERGRIPLSRA